MQAITPIEQHLERAVLCIPLRYILEHSELFKIGAEHDFSRHALLAAVVTIADGMLGDVVDESTCKQYLEKHLTHEQQQAKGLMTEVMECAQRIVSIAPDAATDLMYVTTHNQTIYIRAMINRVR